ncbi:hypothetical protein BXZ70DRAFT_932701 [Cristinia sonorae]|uniref:Non-specific serine/threonine protein kinase n=1 Tax=Cristinia sonorae TaxID=1940300 RepID=A0A8K0XR60_9AGAR|nr:hypothetical protein BXZ70DRAFT_932701 [Cristinia sonorae]
MIWRKNILISSSTWTFALPTGACMYFERVTGTEEEIVVKFVRKYERLPGGYGVTMQSIDPARPLCDIPKDDPNRPRWAGEVHDLVRAFHGVDLVHGDLRDTNIVVDGEERVYLLDLDWVGGKEGEAVYPSWQLNTDLLNGRTHDDLKVRKEDDLRVFGAHVHW